MSDALLESRKAVRQARNALRRGDRRAALKWGQKAARLAPESEDPWLILAAVASPRLSMDYLQKAFEINPVSDRARRGMQWAMRRLQALPQAVPPDETAPSAAVRRAPSAAPERVAGRRRRSALLPVLLFLTGCIIVSFAAWTAVSSPALAAILSLTAPTQPPPAPHAGSWAYAELPKPTYTPTSLPPTPTRTPEPADTPTAVPSLTPEFTGTPESTATPEAALPLEASAVPGLIQAVLVPDTPTPEYSEPLLAPAAPAENPSSIAAAVYGERWIDVDLSQQRVYAYEGE
ncbi:MAG: tetratricopeptide repeat protein, partial [Bacteroidota bacterium]